jgi:O-succinylbenzoic acid--CoA ligase
MSVVDVLARSPGASEETALRGTTDGASASLSWAELDAAVLERSNRLRGGPGVRTIVTPGTDVATVVELLACWRAGVVPVPLNARLSPAEIEHARRVLEEAELPPGTQTVLWTSGTSGRPRGVALSFDNLQAITDASAERLELGPTDVWVGSLSPAHVGGLVLVVRSILLGSTLIAPGPVEVDALDALLSHAPPAPSHLSLVPTQLLRLLDARGPAPAPGGLRCVLIGGAHAPESLVERAVASGWPLALTYGCTEMSSQIATAPPSLVREKRGTVGRPLAGVELWIADDGEVLARGPTRALGYAGETEFPLSDDGGWYHTGDLGRVDSEGHLYVTGRRVDRIVSGGVTIDAIEVEEAIRTHPAVADVCVAGVPDETWGERVGAVLVPVEGEYDPETLEGHLRDRLMAAKVPRVWRLVTELPRNPNGKVDRPAVRSLLSGSPQTRPS